MAQRKGECDIMAENGEYTTEAQAQLPGIRVVRAPVAPAPSGKRAARFRCHAVLGTGRTVPVTVTVHRGRGMVSVRALHARQSYELPLETVARMIAERCMKGLAGLARRTPLRRRGKQ
jgi:hypothetical protein